MKRWTDKVLPSPVSWNHGFWLANLQMPNQLSVSVPYRWLLLFSRNFTISNRFNCPHFSFFFSFVVFLFRGLEMYGLYTCKARSTPQTKQLNMTKRLAEGCVVPVLLVYFVSIFLMNKKVLWKGLGRFLGFSRFKHQRYGQVAQCEGIPGFGLAWCCWQFWSPEIATKKWSFTVLMRCTWSLDPGLFWRPWSSFAIPPFGPLQSHRCGWCICYVFFKKTCVDCLLQFGNLFSSALIYSSV